MILYYIYYSNTPGYDALAFSSFFALLLIVDSTLRFIFKYIEMMTNPTLYCLLTENLSKTKIMP